GRLDCTPLVSGDSQLPQKRLTMRKVKEVLPLHSLGLSQHQTARSCSISQSTVHELSVAAKKGTSLAVEKEPVVGLRDGLHAGGLRVPSRRAGEETPLELPYGNFRCPAATGRSV